MPSCCLKPDITVLLPAYNAEPFIVESVMSILRQSYTNFTLLIIDDGSTDRTGMLLEELASRDPRIELHRRENKGLIATLNEGLSLCRTELVARMDADDIALPDRLAIQKTYMDTHPEVAVCGSDMIAYERGQRMVYPSEERCLTACLFGSPLAHPTVVFRKSMVETLGGYDKTMLFAEDYDLWTRILHANLKIANISQPLLCYREHPQTDRFFYRCRSMQTTQHIWTNLLLKMGIFPTAGELDSHAYCAAPCSDIAWRQQRARKWLETICAYNRQKKIYPQTTLEAECCAIIAHFPQPISFTQAPLLFMVKLMRLGIAALIRDKAHIKIFFHRLRCILR